ncbi:MAG: DUF134 domain-containing protein [Promethearchaeota archaeon]
MGRNTQTRFIKHPPNNFYFRPYEDDTSKTKLTLAEFEAMRLKHYLNLSQQTSASKMGVSQPTFSRILENAHKKMTRALIEGKQISIHGGNVDFKKSFIGFGCLNCNHEWEDETAFRSKKGKCAKCNSDKIYYLVRQMCKMQF